LLRLRPEGNSRAVSSAGERRVDIAKVSGSIPLPPTMRLDCVHPRRVPLLIGLPADIRRGLLAKPCGAPTRAAAIGGLRRTTPSRRRLPTRRQGKQTLALIARVPAAFGRDSRAVHGAMATATPAPFGRLERTKQRSAVQSTTAAARMSDPTETRRIYCCSSIPTARGPPAAVECSKTTNGPVSAS
jgi:hypothetical protein